MKGKLIGLNAISATKQIITIEVAANFSTQYQTLKDVPITVEIKKFYKRRSKDANAYFHVLAHKIAEVIGIDDEQSKRMLVSQYGGLKRDKNNDIVGFKLPQSVNVDEIYPYTRFFKTVEEDNKLFDCYLVLERTHLLNNKDMGRLIDEVVREAKELEIDTDTPETIALYKSRFADKEN